VADHTKVAREVPSAASAEAAAPHQAVPEGRPEAQTSEKPREPVEAPSESAAPVTVAAPSDVAAPPANAARTASGLATRVLQPGNGTAKPGPDARVNVHYSGWTTDGKLFDSSVVRGEPANFPVGGVIPGFREGLMLMVRGEKRRLWIPESLAYKGRSGAPKGMLVFDVELLGIE